MDLTELGRSIDRGLAVIAPQWAAKRANARGMYAALQRAGEMARKFDGASTGRLAGNWFASSGSADTELRPALNRLRARSRDLSANNPWAASAIDSLQTDLAGTGIAWSPRMIDGTENDPLLSKAKRLFLPWIETPACDLRGRQNLYGMQSTGARELVEAGEFIVRRVWTGERPIPFRLLFLEPDHLDTMKDGLLMNDGGRVVQGVEYDSLGRPRAYYLWREHPGDILSSNSWVSDRVPAEDVIHSYEVLRFGQSRGIPRGTPCMIRLRAFDEYENAEEMRKKILSCFVGFVHDLLPDESPSAGMGESTGVDGEQGNAAQGVMGVRKFTPGTFQGLPAGKSITFGQPTGDDNYVDFAMVTLRGVAQAYGVTYEKLTGDLRGVNFSSGRMGQLKYNALLDRLTWHTLVPQVLDRIFAWFLEAMEVTGDLPAGVLAARWTPPKRPMVDPSQEIPAAVKAVRSGFKTRSEVVRELGDNPEELEAEFKLENDRAEKLKLSFDSDGRRPEQQPVIEKDPSGPPPKKAAAA